MFAQTKDFILDHKKNYGLVVLTTIVLYALLCMGLLPTYAVGTLDHYASYCFPIWVIIGIIGSAYLLSDAAKISEQRQEQAPQVQGESPEKPKEE